MKIKSISSVTFTSLLVITSFILLSNIVPISNSVFAEEYRNEKFQFSIEYPDNWVYEDDYGAADGSSGIVSFVDKLPDWTTEISIVKSNLDRNSLHLSDQQFLDLFIVQTERFCIVATHAIDGHTCSNFRLENSKILNINEKKAFQLQYSITMNYSDGPNDDFTWLVTQIIDNNQSWSIISSAYSDEFSQYFEMLDSSHRSFQLESSENKNSIFPSDYHSYSNSVFGYKFDYPSTWMKTETGDTILHAIITSPFDNEDDEFAEIIMSGGETLFIDIDLDGYTKLTIRSFETPNFKILDSNKITLSGQPAQKISFSDKDEFGEDTRGIAAWTVFDKKGYFVMMGVEPSKYSEYLPIFERTLESYEIDETLKEEIKLNLVFEDYSTHVDSVNGIKFQYPAQWNKLDLDKQGIHNIITAPLENYNDVFAETVVIATEEIPFGLLNLEMYYEITMANLSSATDFKIIEEENTTLAKLPAKKIVFSQIDPNYNIEIKTLTTFTVKDDKAYVIALGSEPSKYSDYLPIFEKIIDSFEIGEFEPPTESSIPDWIKNNAKWWVDGTLDDKAFVGGIQFLIKEGIMSIPETSQSTTGDGSQEIPSWIKNNADWWSQELISDDDFIKGIRFMVENGFITV